MRRRLPGGRAGNGPVERGARGRVRTLLPGGSGSPSAPTKGGCLEWLDAVGLKAGQSRTDKRRSSVGPHPEVRLRRQKSPQVERRVARALSQSALRRKAVTYKDAPLGAPSPRFEGTPSHSARGKDEGLTRADQRTGPAER